MRKLKKWWRKICFEKKIRKLDEQWHMHFGYCFGMYPPSFYYRHTPEEIKEISERDFKHLREMIVELNN